MIEDDDTKSSLIFKDYQPFRNYCFLSVFFFIVSMALLVHKFAIRKHTLRGIEYRGASLGLAVAEIYF